MLAAMQESTFTFDSDDGTTVTVDRWAPDGQPVRIVQIAHGMGEHARRYRRLAEALTDAGVQVALVSRTVEGRLDVREAFRALRAAGVKRALLECGGTLMGSAMRAGVVHQVMAFTAPVVVGGTDAPGPFGGLGWPIGAAPRLTHVRASAVGDDALLEGYWPA